MLVNRNATEGTHIMDHFNRTTKFTNKEFKALERNEDGDILDDLESGYTWMTTTQIDNLSGDDYSRVDDYREEMRYMIADL